MSEFQLNFFSEVNELFIDGTFQIAPKNWYHVLNIGYNKNKNFYMPLAYVVLISKTKEIYKEILHKLVELIKYHIKKESYEDIKIICDFEIGLREAIKDEFQFCILQGCYFHYFKAIWKK